MFKELEDKLDQIRRGLDDFTTRFDAGLFVGKPDVVAKHVALGRMDVLDFLHTQHEALVAFEIQVENAIKLGDEEARAMKKAITDLQDALTDPELAAAIVSARAEAKQADLDAEIAKKREAVAGEAKDEPAKVGVGG